MWDVEEILGQMTLEEKAQMCSGRDFWKTQDCERLGIPSIMMCDGPNGLRKQIGEADHLGINESIETVCYPTASAVASSFDTEMMREIGEMLGEECQAENVGMLLGPGVNMKRSPLCGRNFEYFSEDPYLAGQLAAAYIKGLQSKGVSACVKHFAANDQETMRMSGSSQVDERTLHEIYLPAFEAAVKEGKTRSIMNAYNAVNGTFCAENKELLTDILRDDWGFDGFVVTDWGAVKDRVKGLKAGVDLEMPGSTEGKTADIIKAVESGELDEAVLDKAVRNLLRFVHTAQENGLTAGPKKAEFDRGTARELAACAAAESAVLLKNDGVLPLSKQQKVAFIGSFAEAPRYQGAGSSHIHVSHVVSVLEAVAADEEIAPENIIYAKGYTEEGAADPALVAEACAAAKAADVAVIFAGLPESYETEGADRESMDMPAAQNALIEEIVKVQKNVVVVLHGGSSIILPWRDKVSAILNMHLGGDMVGEAEAKLLYGETNPSGKLAETWPIKLEDNPSYLNFPGESGIVEYREGIFIGYRYYDKKKMDVQYPFGHGLSYTTFEYSDIRLSADTITDTDSLTVTFKVRNTGSRFGKETAQLYTSVYGSAVRRPVRELKGFAKVALAPGEEKEVSITISAKAFAYYEPKIGDWFIERGKARVEIGASCRDIRLGADLKVDSAMELPYTFTKTSTIGDLTKTAKGREVFAQMLAGMGMSPDDLDPDKAPADAEQDEAMGAGAARMRAKMMIEMPLSALVSYGVMPAEALDGMLAMLNG